MSKSSNYRLIKKRWFFWIPLILMIISLIALFRLIQFGLYCDYNQAITNMTLLFYFFVMFIFIWSYFLVNRIVHFSCGIISIFFSCFSYWYFFKDMFDISIFSSYILLLPPICLLVSGFFFIYWSFNK